MQSYSLHYWVAQQTNANVMVFGVITYNMWSCFLHIQSNLNSNHYIKGGFRAQDTPPLSGNLFHISIGHCPATCDDDCAILLWRITAKHVAHQTCHRYGWLATCSPWSVQQSLLTLCGFAYKLCRGRFPRNIFRSSLITYHNAQRLRLQHMEALHHTKISWS